MNIVVMNAWQMFFKGGAMMWPLLALSVMAMAIAISKVAALSRLERQLHTDQKAILSALRAGDLKEALVLCEQNSPSPLGDIAKAGIMRFASTRDLIKGSMEEAAVFHYHQLKKHMDMLGLVVNVAPMLGLLGTVSAMTVVFHAVQVRSNLLNPLTAGELASGIWQALLTTAAGLLVGILSFTVHAFCAMRINAVAAYIQRSMLEITNVLQQLSELKQPGEREHV